MGAGARGVQGALGASGRLELNVAIRTAGSGAWVLLTPTRTPSPWPAPAANTIDSDRRGVGVLAKAAPLIEPA